MNIESIIRDVPDFPKEGIIFKDITPLLKNPKAFEKTISDMAKPFLNEKIDYVIGAESRGFIFGAPLALKLGAGFVPVRKPGKLPYNTISEEYSLEYGKDKVEIHEDAVEKGKKVLIVDDLLATGGTCKACIDLVERLGGEVKGIVFLIELLFLDGRKKLGDRKIHSLIKY
ncbi:MAG: adenine phosphoribosyltransferase [Candidatus Muirbacterium halophilum]|nr:adenine phosphoribosyltransferase [Candidatus Muirbacterium halophilum]MCK9476642.1 adenine phosphoribosyltransferase [Candidatus Muirbacterium halophilum]